MMLVLILVFILIVVMVLMLAQSCHCILEHFLFHIIRLRNNAEQLLTLQILKRCRDDNCLRIDLADNLHRFLNLCLIGNIGSGKHNGSGKGNLVVEEFAEIPCIHFCLLGIHNSNGCIQCDILVLGNSTHRADDI